MSRRGDFQDTVMVQSLRGKQKTEVVNLTKFATQDEARTTVFECIELFCNREQLHAVLGKVSPVECEAVNAG